MCRRWTGALPSRWPFAPTATTAGNVSENAACPAPLVVTGVEPRNRRPRHTLKRRTMGWRKTRPCTAQMARSRAFPGS